MSRAYNAVITGIHQSNQGGDQVTINLQSVDNSKAEAVKSKKQWSELDKYIELLLDSKQTDQSVFVYLNPNTNLNPYDL